MLVALLAVLLVYLFDLNLMLVGTPYPTSTDGLNRVRRCSTSCRQTAALILARRSKIDCYPHHRAMFAGAAYCQHALMTNRFNAA